MEMDIVEKQTQTYRRRERKVVNWIFGFCITMLVVVIAFTTPTAEADENPYVYGENVFTCPTELDRNRNYDCRAKGENTPMFKNLPFVNVDTGVRTMENVHGYLPVRCSEYGCAVVTDMKGFREGTIVGEGGLGTYIVESGWYLGFDAEGKTVAYRMDTGPSHGLPPYGAASTRSMHYGEEKCYDVIIAEILEEDPNAVIPYEAIVELRATCGLTTEE